jgi:hypothetical protein
MVPENFWTQWLFIIVVEDWKSSLIFRITPAAFIGCNSRILPEEVNQKK